MVPNVYRRVLKEEDDDATRVLAKVGLAYFFTHPNYASPRQDSPPPGSPYRYREGVGSGFGSPAWGSPGNSSRRSQAEEDIDNSMRNDDIDRVRAMFMQ